MKRRNLLTGLGAAVATGMGGHLAATGTSGVIAPSVFIAKAADYRG